MKHIVFFSSGLGSWSAAKRVASEFGTENLILLFADTLIEDIDNYRFLDEAAQNVGGTLIKIADGRTPWQVFKDVRWLGNSRVAQCSHELKQKVCLEWINKNANPECDRLYVGIDWSEVHRLVAIKKHWQPYQVIAPMTEAPYLDKFQVIDLAKSEGLEPPRLYRLGFTHSNCGGRCVRAGVAHWKHLHNVLPEHFREAEEEEQGIRELLGKEMTILTRQYKGKKEKLTLKQLREEIENNGQLDLFDWGGCGCFTED